MATREKPFKGKFLNEIVFNILEGKYKELQGNYSKELQSLIKQMLDKDPLKRPSIQEILS